MEAKSSRNPSHEEHVMQVLVIGATGRVGRHLTRRLREERVPMRALIRSRDKALTVFPDADDTARPLEIVWARSTIRRCSIAPSMALTPRFWRSGPARSRSRSRRA